MMKSLATLSTLVLSYSSSLSDSTSSLSFSLPKVDYGDLLSMDETVSLQVAHHLQTLGGVQVVGIPKFHELKELALKDLANCLLRDSEAVQTTMKDGSKRLTTGAPNFQGVPQEMTSVCGTPATKLRSTINSATQQLLKALDSTTITSEKVLSPYEKFEDIGQFGDHLEHLHSYYSTKENQRVSSQYGADRILSQRDNRYTMDIHTDAGLFIAMTNGFYSPPSRSNELLSSLSTPSNGLYIQLPSGEVVEALTDFDSLIFMVGQGGSDWLAPILGTKLRALPHGLVAEVDGGWTRSWFGKMYLPPNDALIPGTEGSYASYRMRELSVSKLAAQSNEIKFSEYLPAACGMSSGSDKLLEMVQNTLCDNGNGVYCWQQCVPLSDYSCGTEAECIDTATGEPVDGTIMCPSAAGMSACQVQCPIPANKTEETFCWGAGTDMYMDGFTSILQEKEGSTACLNLFFKDWTLDKKYKYALGCIGVFLLGVIVEYLSSVRRLFFKKLPESYVRNISLMLLHCTQVCLGYFLMLAAMTYNVEIFCMVLAGIGAGHALFNLKAPPQNTDHCCASANDALLDDESGKQRIPY